ncbi:MAG TPA: hypothetical protein VHX86_15500 [Tepidisphaeraceae bacterium]|jgi:hypothetical protein|nr:hypothetical protein [Tepidisphaeraceae bacterium]
MRYLRRSTAWAVIFVVMTAVPSLFAQQVDNPDYLAWAKFKVGSSRTLSGTVLAGGLKIEVQTTYTLREVTADHVVVESRTTTDFGPGPRVGRPVRQIEDAKVEGQEVKDLGEENVQALGRWFKCEVYQMKDDTVDGKERPWGGKAKVWVCADVPGGVVRWDVNPQNTKASEQDAMIVYGLSGYVVK